MIFKNLGITFKNKLKAATLLFSVLVLILLTNLQERYMIKNLNGTVTSIYEDRVVVGNYILSLSNDMDDIIKVLQSDDAQKISKAKEYLSDIDSLNILYEKTYLTNTEKINFNQYKDLCLEIKQAIRDTDRLKAITISLEAQKILKILSSIQVDEGKNKLDEVLSMTSTRNIFSYLEIVIIIVISILVQKIILSSKPININKREDHHHLN